MCDQTQRQKVMQYIGDYGERVFFTPGLGDATRADAVAGLIALFDPGDVVDAAYAAGDQAGR